MGLGRRSGLAAITIGWAVLLAAGAAAEVQELPIPDVEGVVSVAGPGRMHLLVFREHVTEIWQTDGTPANTRKLAQVPGQAFAYPLGERLLCIVPAMQLAGSDLIVVHPDGKLESIGQVGFAPPGMAAVAGNRVVIPGEQLAATDGTRQGTIVLRQAPPNGPGTLALSPGPTDATVLFLEGDALWITDGTLAGTRIVKALRPASDQARPPMFFGFGGGRFGGNALFTFVNWSDDFQITRLALWATDGTPAGTWVISPNIATPATSWNTPMSVWKNRVYLAVQSAEEAVLLGTGGQPDDLETIAHLPSRKAPAGQPSFVWQATFAPVAKAMLFTHDAGAGKVAVWATDGTENGTRPLGIDGPDKLSPMLYADGPRAVIAATADTIDASRAWVSDGTPEGTRLLVDGAHVLGVRAGIAYLSLPGKKVGAVHLDSAK